MATFTSMCLSVFLARSKITLHSNKIYKTAQNTLQSLNIEIYPVKAMNMFHFSNNRLFLSHLFKRDTDIFLRSMHKVLLSTKGENQTQITSLSVISPFRLFQFKIKLYTHTFEIAPDPLRLMDIRDQSFNRNKECKIQGQIPCIK